MWAKGFPDRANAFPGSWNYTGCCISPYSFVPINIYSVVSKPELAISCSSPSVKKVCESSLVFTLQFSHWWKFWHTRLFIITWKPQWKPYNSLQSENRPYYMWFTTFFPSIQTRLEYLIKKQNRKFFVFHLSKPPTTM